MGFKVVSWGPASPPQPHTAGASEAGATQICRSAGRTAFLSGETSIIHSLLASDTPPPLGGVLRKQAGVLWALPHPPSFGWGKGSPSYPGHLSRQPPAIWGLQEAPPWQEQTMLGDRQGTNPHAQALLTFWGSQTSLRI